jgi:formylglycine-generating enzyme required for sulfatase activity
MHRTSEDTAPVLCDFLLQIRSDTEAGSLRRLSEYLGRFPECEVEVAREYLAFVAEPEEQRSDVRTPVDSDEALLVRLSSQRRTIDRYNVGGEIGRGGMATVRSVRDLELDRDLAMKVIARAGGVARRRFLAEASVTGRLDHPGIVPVHDLGVDGEGRLFFTMRRVEGIDFEQAIARVHARDRDWTLSRALEVLIKVCDTLAFAHTRGIVHRDLKPSNVMTGRFGEVYVVDWGLARARPGHEDGSPSAVNRAEDADENPWLTRDGDVTGTPAYMSPEQAMGKASEIDARSDVYAAGAILYQLLTNRRPYSDRGRDVSTREVLARVVAGPPDPVRNLRRDAPVELVAICEKAMQREPRERFTSMEEMARDLRAFLERRVVAAHASGIRARARKWISRNRALSLVCGLALTGGLLAITNVVYERAEARRRLVYVSGGQLASAFEELWPPGLESLPVLQRWISDVREYLSTREENLARLNELQQRARPMDPSRPAERKARADRDDRIRHLIQWITELRDMGRDFDAGVNRLPEGCGRSWVVREIGLNERMLHEAEDQPMPQVTFEFDDPDDQRLYDALVRVLQDQAAFTGGEPRPSLLHLAEWGLSASRRVAQQSLEDARGLWVEAIASITDERACPLYHGLHLAPQLGLLPIGRDPASGLWEFAHVLSGEVPTRTADGRLEMREDGAIILVLIPGGTLLRGSQRERIDAPNFDPWAEANAPCGDRVPLEPFFLSKYEMTQGQWLRVVGWNPSSYAPSSDPSVASIYADTRFGVSGLHPVEQVSIVDAALVTKVLGLTLPTEAQWEWAARATSDRPWWSGWEPCEAQGTENFADRSAAFWHTAPFAETAAAGGFDDGWPVHAPVGSLAPNRFGLHDMLGNVREWCGDRGAFAYSTQFRVLNGERAGLEDGSRAVRGGSFELDPIRGRTAAREQAGLDMRRHDIGLRPARGIDR